MHNRRLSRRARVYERRRRLVRCAAAERVPRGKCGVKVVSGLGGECHNDYCFGTFVCSTDKGSAVCNAPQLNECELCGGPAVPNLGTVCTASAGCAGRLACNAGGTNSLCDCSVNICNDGTTIRDIVPPDVGDLVITEVMPSPPSKVSDTVGGVISEVRVMKDVDLNNLASIAPATPRTPNGHVAPTTACTSMRALRSCLRSRSDCRR